MPLSFRGFGLRGGEDVVGSVFADRPEERRPSFARLDSRGRLSPHEPLSLCNLDVRFGYAFPSFVLYLAPMVPAAEKR